MNKLKKISLLFGILITASQFLPSVASAQPREITATPTSVPVGTVDRGGPVVIRVRIAPQGLPQVSPQSPSSSLPSSGGAPAPSQPQTPSKTGKTTVFGR